MKQHNSFLPSGSKRCVAFIFLLSLIAILLSIGTLNSFYSFSENNLGFYNINHGPREDDPNKILGTITKKLVKEIENLHKKSKSSTETQIQLKIERRKQATLLVEIFTLVSSLEKHLNTPFGKGNARNRYSLSKNNQPYDEIIDNFLIEEIRKYVGIKPNRLGKKNFMGANGTFTSIGHACFSMKKELAEYMNYTVGGACKDDWKLAQKLMVHGCDPLPRRRCFSVAPKWYTKPYPINESIWKLPNDRNVRWSWYKCKNFTCLASNSTGKGFFKCPDCFNLTRHELPKWIEPIYVDPSSNLTSDFLIQEVLGIKPGEIRIGLDFSIGTGTFAARMREYDITIISAIINLGAPFSEMIALRGLVPLYLTVNQRLPFFDNTLDIIHTTRFLDGWIDIVLLDFVLYDWDRVLRPGGLLWIDNFFCLKEDLHDYLQLFNMVRYKKHKWVQVPKIDKEGDEVFFSAVLEKPPRPF